MMVTSSALRGWIPGVGVVVAALLATTACNSGSPSRGAGSVTGASPVAVESDPVGRQVVQPRGRGEPPVISSLTVRALDPQRVNRRIRYRIQVNVVDPDGDFINGQAEIFLNGRSIGRARIRPLAGTPSNAQRGFVRGDFWVRVSAPLRIDGRFQIYDRAGHQSNALEFALAIGEARRDLPLQRTDQDMFDAEIESTTVSH